MVGHGEDQLPDARPRHRAPQPRRAERARRDQHRARLRADRPAGLRLRDDHRPGQRPGRPRARPEVRPASRRPRHRATPSTAPTSPRSGASTRAELPHAGRRLPTRSSARSTAARSRGLLSICFNPMVSLPDNDFVARMLEKLEFYVGIDFFLSETRPATPTSSCPARCRKRTRASSRRPKAGSSRSTRPSTAPGEARQDWRIIQDIAKALGREHGFTFDEPARDLRRAARRVQGRRRRLLRHHLREDRGSSSASSGRAAMPEATDDHPGTPRLFEPGSWNPVAKGAGPFYFPDGKARFNVAAVRAAGRGRRRRVSGHPDHRPRRQPVPLRHADPAHRPAGRPVSGAADRDAPAAGEASYGIADGDWATVESAARQLHAARAGGDDDPPGHGLHPVPLGRAARAPTS